VLLDLDTLNTICGGRLQGIDAPATVMVRGVSTDSRRCRAGDVFVALRGARSDGHRYVESALQAGAVAAVVCEGTEVSGHALVVVADPLRALQQLAGWARRQHLNEVVAITGSNGKTIVKDALTALLAGRFRVASSPGSYNSQLGVPLSILGMQAGLELAVLEVGVSAVGEMAHQQAIVSPTYGVLTNIGLAHIGSFGDRAKTAREKIRLFEGLGPEGWLLVPADEPLLTPLLSSCQTRIVTFGGGGDDVPQLVERSDSGMGSLLTVDFPVGGRRSFGVKTRSPHLITDLLCAMTAASLLGVDSDDIAATLEGYSFGPTRLEIWRSPQGVTLINDALSADPLSVQAALEAENATATGEGRRIFVFGGMNELGDREIGEHRLIGTLAARQGMTHLIVPERASTKETARAFAAESQGGQVVVVGADGDLGETLRGLAKPGDSILIKGPRGDGLDAVAHAVWESMSARRLVVDLPAIRENIACFRRLVEPNGAILAMLKAWAYGTELGRVARWLQRSGVDWIGVSAADEGAMVRRAGVHLPILVTLLDASDVDKVVRYRLTPAVYSEAMAQALMEAADRHERCLDVHLKVDTGMGRLGVAPDAVVELARRMEASGRLNLTGVMTHLSCADDPGADAFTDQQLAQFDTALSALSEAGIAVGLRHAAATSGAVRFAHARYDMIRVGLGLYGIHPSPAVEEALELQLALALLGRIAHISDRRRGERIGYGGTFVVERAQMRVGIVQMGYNDGVPWRLSNRGAVMVGGRMAAIVGRVSMDSLAVDLSEHPHVGVGDEVLLYGEHEGHVIRPEDVAELAGTIPYELLVKIDSRRVQRLFVGD